MGKALSVVSLSRGLRHKCDIGVGCGGRGPQTVLRTSALWTWGVDPGPRCAPNSALRAILPQEAPQSLMFTHCSHQSWSPSRLTSKLLRLEVKWMPGNSGIRGNGWEKKNTQNRTDLSKEEETTALYNSLVTGDEVKMDSKRTVKIPWPHWVQY